MPPVGTVEIEDAITKPEQSAATVAPEIKTQLENHSDEVLKVLDSEDEQVAQASGEIPSGSSANNELWNQPEAASPAAEEKPVELVTPAAEQSTNEAPISMDSPFMATAEAAAAPADTKDEAFGEDVTLDFAPAENMIRAQAEDPNRGIHHQITPEAKAATTAEVVQRAEVADAKLEQVGSEVNGVDQIEDPEERLKARESSLGGLLDRILTDLDEMETAWEQRGQAAETKAQTEIAEAEAEAAQAQEEKVAAEDRIIAANNRKIEAQNRLEEEKGRIAAEKARIDAKRQNVLELKS